MQRVEIGDAVDAEHDRFAIEFEDAYHDVLEPSGLRDQSRISNVAFEDAYHDLLEPSGLRNLSLTSGNGGNAQNLALGHGNTRAQTVQHAPAPAAHSYSGHASNETFRGQPTPQYASTSSSGVRSSAFSPSRLAAPQPSRALPQPTSKSHFHDPGDGYRVKVDRKSPYLYLHDAGIDAINSINEQSILRSKEFGGILYRDPDKGTYGYTGPVIGKKGGFDYSRPEVRLRPGTEFAGTFHTHGSHSRLSKTNAIIKTYKSHDEFASDNFSRQDILNNLRRASTEHDHSRLYGGRRTSEPPLAFLGTPSWKIRVHNASAATEEATAARDPKTGEIMAGYGSDVVLQRSE